MKTKMTISFRLASFMLLAAILLITFYQLSTARTQSSELEPFAITTSPSELPIISNCTIPGHPNRVSLPCAETEIALYQLWLKHIPKTVVFDTSSVPRTIYFPQVEVSEEDFNFLRSRLRNLWTQDHMGFTYPVTPFIGVKDRAYFISKKDITTALDAFDNRFIPNSDSDTSTGIRVYLGEGYAAGNGQTPSFGTHLYVVPTYFGSNGDTLDYIPHDGGHDYVLDLTTPCPAACDVHSPLNAPTF